jgi:hypothetical protein
MQNILHLYNFKEYTDFAPPELLTRLQKFYEQPELHPKQVTKHSYSIYNQLQAPIQFKSGPSITSNRYSILMPSENSEPMEASTAATPNKHRTSMTNNAPPTPTETLWVNDTSVVRLSDVIINQLQIDRQNREDSGEKIADHNSQYEDPAFQVIPPVQPIQRMRFNLIRRRDTSCDITTLKLFKSFMSTLREIDNEINILPFETNKYHISPLTNARQINALDDNKLQLYFRSYHRKQHYSLSGYFHVGTSMNAEELFQHPKLLEWLDGHRYFIKLSPSQSEEMVQIGALLFSSIYMYRADLKLSILNHPLWKPTDPDNQPIFELFTADLIASDKKT